MAFLDAILRTNGCSGIQHGGNHQVWWVPVKLFNQLPIEKWEFNRDPDMDRVAEIRNHILQAKRVDGIIQLAVIGKKIVCYESNHRRMALEGIEDCADVLIDVFLNASDELLKEEFRRLNKAVSVSELYIAEKPVAFNDLIAARDAFCKKYKLLKVTTDRPQRPNFNAERLLDDFVEIVKEHNISVEEMMRRLDNLNVRLSHKAIDSKLTDKVKEKCTNAGMWLFAWTGRINPKDVI